MTQRQQQYSLPVKVAGIIIKYFCLCSLSLILIFLISSILGITGLTIFLLQQINWWLKFGGFIFCFCGLVVVWESAR